MNGYLRAQAIKEYKNILIILDSSVFTFDNVSRKLYALRMEANRLKVLFNL